MTGSVLDGGALGVATLLSGSQAKLADAGALGVSTLIDGSLNGNCAMGNTAVQTSFVGVAAAIVAPGATAVYTAQIVDEFDVGIAGSALVSLTLSLRDSASGVLVNNVETVDILNIGRGVVDEDGGLTLTLTPQDTGLLGDGSVSEYRSMVFVWTYAGGVKVGRHQVDFEIDPLIEN